MSDIGKISADIRYICRYQIDIGYIGINNRSKLRNSWLPRRGFLYRRPQIFHVRASVWCKSVRCPMSDVRCSQSDRDDRDRIAISGHISEIEHFWSKIALVNEPKFQICPISERYRQISDISADIRQISDISKSIIAQINVIHCHRPRIVLLLACSVS